MTYGAPSLLLTNMTSRPAPTAHAVVTPSDRLTSRSIPHCALAPNKCVCFNDITPIPTLGRASLLPDIMTVSPPLH